MFLRGNVNKDVEIEMCKYGMSVRGKNLSVNMYVKSRGKLVVCLVKKGEEFEIWFEKGEVCVFNGDVEYRMSWKKLWKLFEENGKVVMS